GIAWAPSFGILVVSTVLFGAAMFLPFAAQVTLAQDYLPNRPGTASGLTLGLAMAAGGLCSPLFGWLADSSGLPAAFYALLGLFVLPVLLAFRLLDPRGDTSESGASSRPEEPVDTPGPR
ncbi:MFS transporter, partial [Streptomyces roseolus]